MRIGLKLSCVLQALQLALERDRVNDGFGTTWQPQHALTQAPYVAKNLLYYDSSERAAVALTDAEKAQLVQARPHPPLSRFSTPVPTVYSRVP